MLHLTLQYFNNSISSWISVFWEPFLWMKLNRATQLVTWQVFTIECSKGNKGKVFGLFLYMQRWEDSMWWAVATELSPSSCVALRVRACFPMQPSVSFPVTIDGFLCPPAHKGTQVIEWTDRGTERWNRDVQAVCLSVQQCVCVCGSWGLAPLWLGSLWKHQSSTRGHTSTSVMLAVVTDSQTFWVLLPPLQIRLYLVAVTSLGAAPHQSSVVAVRWKDDIPPSVNCRIWS